MNNTQDWILSESQEYLRCKLLLENKFNHAFFTKKFDLKNNTSFKFNTSKECTNHKLKQIHSNKIINSKNSTREPWEEADGLISTKNRNQILWLYSADCIPILLADKSTGRVAAVHAGWKGIANNIIKYTIEKFEKYGTNKKELIIALGPSISKSRYQVNLNLVKDISNSIRNKNINFDKNVVNSELKLMFKKGIIEKDIISEKFLLDIRLAALEQLHIKGLKDNQISVNKNCTFLEENLFFSWRRTGSKDYQWSYIESKIY